MAEFIGLGKNNAAKKAKRMEIVQTKQQPVASEAGSMLTADINAFLKQEIHPSLEKFLLFWALMDTIHIHGYSRAAMGTIGRATVGTWWSLREHEQLRDQASQPEKNKLMSFYNYEDRQWDNIKDFQTPAYKFMLTAMYLRYFGQAALHIVRNNAGTPIGLDFLPGLIVPNVDSEGYFKEGEPAFIQYPSRNPKIRTEFEDPRELVYLVNPDWEGSPLGGSDVEALSEYVLPLDLYLQQTAREYMKNRNKPELIYMLPSDISDDAFDTFVEKLTSKYAGPRGAGKNPIAVQGELDVKELENMPEDLPYGEGRNTTREETMAVSGTHSALLGLGDKVSSAALKEIRRHFHETTMEPLFAFMEQGFYEQIHVREFDAPEWVIQFNSPDFLNAVEKATVHRRYREIGVFNPNEIRHDLGEAPREDGGGDDYWDKRPGEPQGSPPEGREDEPDSPGNVGEPSDDEGDPERGDQHDDETEHSLRYLTEQEVESLADNFTIEVGGELVPIYSEESLDKISFDNVLDELATWRRFSVGRIKKGQNLRTFYSKVIPPKANIMIQGMLEEARSEEEVKEIFSDVRRVLEAL